MSLVCPAIHKPSGHHTRLVAYIPATTDRTRLDEFYPVEQPVFFTFVAFGEKPHYLRGLETDAVAHNVVCHCSRRLNHWDAQMVHTHTPSASV